QSHAALLQDRFAHARNERAIEIDAEKLNLHACRAVALAKAGRSYTLSIFGARARVRNEIGLRIGDGATRERSADCHVDRRPEKAARRDRFNLQSSHCRERTFSQRRDSKGASHRKIRRNGIAGKTTRERDQAFAGRLRSKERKTARKFRKVVVEALAAASACLFD